MRTRLDHMKGTIKEKIGWLTNDHGVERDGKREQVMSDNVAKENDDTALDHCPADQASDREGTRP